MNRRQTNRYAAQIATTICQALGMPSRFAAEKEPVSSTLPTSLASYLQGLSPEGLARVGVHGTPLAREAAAVETERRYTLTSQLATATPSNG